MYERFYHLRERPFSLTPDPDYLYPSRVHQEALNYLRYGIEAHAGFVVITGEIGCGKTTLLQTVLRGLDKQTSVSRIVNTMLDPRELIEAVMLDFGLDPGEGRSKPMLLRDLARFLVDQRMSRRLALLVVDEAQNLSAAALEEVRMLSNLETEKSKLIQVVLIGQPNLRDVLSRRELEQLRQRITVSYHLSPLCADETAAYVNHRLKRAALGAPMQFPPDVTALIHQHSQGVPRKINIIADAILLFGYGEDRRVIDADLTAQVLEELVATGVISATALAAASQPTVAPAAARAAATASSAATSRATAATTPGAAAAMTPTSTAPGATRSPNAVPVPSTPIPPLSAEPRIDAPRSATEIAALAARERDLAMREARLLEREQQLAEQRRVLIEGFDLMRTRREVPTATKGASERGNGPWPPARPAPSPTTFNAQPSVPMVRPVARQHEERLWSRLRRSIFGSPKPVFEE